MEIVWIKSPDCRACAFDLENSSRRKLERIAQERKRCRKCEGCEMLREVEKGLEDEL